MLVDVVKYLLTIIVIGNIFTEKINLVTTIMGIVAAVCIGIIAFYVIPKDKEE